MLGNQNVNYNELIKLTNNGIDVADFVQIRNAFTKRYKEIYGQDIDLSTGSADGQYVEMHSLIINNILDTIKQTYASLDANTANGHMLDIICGLSNVVRKEATRSIATIGVKNVGNADLVLEANTKFVDKSGTTWTYTGANITLPTSSANYNSILVECDELGPVSAPGDADNGNGWINQTVENLAIDVKQFDDCDMGSYQETDAQLRARRNASISMNGFTVLESLQGALLSILGIDDVLIYNNYTNAAQTYKDSNVSVLAHSIYVIIRYREDVIVDDAMIGQIIYNKLTPGIGTTAPTYYTANAHSYVVQVTDTTSQTMNWLKALPIDASTNKVNVTLKMLPNFDQDTILPLIGKRVKDYLNNLQLGVDATVNPVWSEVVYADPLLKGKATYSVVNVSFGNSSPKISNPDRYYAYTGAIDDISVDDDEISFTIE